MTAVDYDFEFIEDGRTIRSISIGMAADDGREYYAVVRDMDTMYAAVRHPWLRANVLPSLPIASVYVDECPDVWDWDDEHPDKPRVKPVETIADEVRAFLQATPDLELWAYYGAYDHVCLAQLFGTMVQLPGGIPMFTNDIAQEAHRLGLSTEDLPRQPAGLHHALADARHNRVRREFLRRYAAEHFDN
ncbi:3'-5' exoribonuclease [Embleya sp. NPDC005971]|uniref:3'-5' exoribonuclease domain-containing protein n=1 Tax=Embleya sp. NPDC005971 TaxID=3156724 RepID=UPI0033F5E630